MPIPQAIVTVELTDIQAIPATLVPAATNRVYALTRIGTRELGRTALIPTGAATFALGRKLAVPVATGESLHIAVEIWEDMGDAEPKQRGWTYMHDIAPPWKSGPFTVGAGPRITGTVTTVTVLPGGARVAAPRLGSGAKPVVAVAAPRRSFAVEFTEILGLWEPGYSPPGPLGRPVRRAEYHAGYTSADHRGRIYLNRDLTGNWVRDTQLIQVTARVNVASGTLKAGTKIRWTVLDPDDPFDDNPHVHRESAAYLDPKDYPGGTPSGAQGGDNEGIFDQSPRWEEVSGYVLTVNSPTEALTLVKATESKVRIHCPNMAGDNLIVRAEIDPVPKGASGRSFPAETGIMTMWNRIDVAYIKMASSLPLPVADAPPLLESACIQLDFDTVTLVADRPEMSGDDDERNLWEASKKYIASNFKAAPGWFCLVSAMLPYPVNTADPPFFTGSVDVHSETAPPYREYVELDKTYPKAATIEFDWGGNKVTFEIADRKEVPAHSGFFGTKTRYYLEPHDVNYVFEAADGCPDNAVKKSLLFHPKATEEGGTITPGGYSIPSPVHAVVKSRVGFYRQGYSPPEKVGSLFYGVGRTIVFTHHGALRDPKTGLGRPTFNDDALGTIVHELTHGFGQHHKCGHYDYIARRDKTCCMNYSPNWMIDPIKKALIPGTAHNVGHNLCGAHIKELRRTHIEENKALKW